MIQTIHIPAMKYYEGKFCPSAWKDLHAPV